MPGFFNVLVYAKQKIELRWSKALVNTLRDKKILKLSDFVSLMKQLTCKGLPWKEISSTFINYFPEPRSLHTDRMGSAFKICAVLPNV